jgi:hypothetical protein
MRRLHETKERTVLKTLTLAAFTVAAAAAVAQTGTSTTTTTTITTQTTAPQDGQGNWQQRCGTYAIGAADMNSISMSDRHRIIRMELNDINAGKAYTVRDFLSNLPREQQEVVIKAMVNNFRQASIVRDEVAMTRFGNSGTYAWLSYPPLTWSATPGQNSWSQITTTTSVTTTTDATLSNSDMNQAVAMTDDQSRPMRMVMAHRGARDINYDQAVDILGAGLSIADRDALADIFHERTENPLSFTNAEALDGIICVINNNATMVDSLNRWSWYNHFVPNYYSSHHWNG